MLCLVDDFADAGEKVMHSSTNILTSLFVRGRHLGCACWLLTQKLRVVSLICRTNFRWMLIWRLRNSKELLSILEEIDALVDRKLLNEMYSMATTGNTRSGKSICWTSVTPCSTKKNKCLQYLHKVNATTPRTKTPIRICPHSFASWP